MDENRQLAIIIDGKRYEKRKIEPEDITHPCDKCALEKVCDESAGETICTAFGLEMQNDCNFQEVEETTEAIGNAIKYLWRAGLKQDADKTEIQKEIEDLEKAVWYINDRIKQLKTKK